MEHKITLVIVKEYKKGNFFYGTEKGLKICLRKARLQMPLLFTGPYYKCSDANFDTHVLLPKLGRKQHKQKLVFIYARFLFLFLLLRNFTCVK
jgi:hypothetical protein